MTKWRGARTTVVALLASIATPQCISAVLQATDAIEADWRPIPDDELLVMTLAGGHVVTIRLAARFTPAHAANIRKLALAHWWDGTSVYRVGDNWVAEWGDPTGKKPLPEGVAAEVAPEFEIPSFAVAVKLAKADGYSTASGFTADGWPIATDGHSAWLTHCYGSVGVGREDKPESGSGADLYTPIGQSPRRLDRNYAVVGRVIAGMGYLSALPRADAGNGVYASASERMPIVSIRLASDLPAADRPHYEYRATDNPRFAALWVAHEQPRPFRIGSGADVCEDALAVRRVGG